MGRPSYIAKDGYNTFTLDNGFERPYELDWLHGKSSGTSMVQCDLETVVNWWGIKKIEDVPAIPLDANGIPERWCSGYLHGGHYSPIITFNKNRAKENGLSKMCRQCEKELRDHQRATAKSTNA